MHGFLGPNGAGKPSTLRILLGLVKADGGSVRLLRDPDRRRRSAPGHTPMFQAMSHAVADRCRDSSTWLARMRGGIDNARRANRALRPGPNQEGAQSTPRGNRQSLWISALSSHATLLLLDEPSSGLDPLMENVFQRRIGEARQRGVTVLLSSHTLAETEALCEKVTIIRAGNLVESGSSRTPCGTSAAPRSRPK